MSRSSQYSGPSVSVGRVRVEWGFCAVLSFYLFMSVNFSRKRSKTGSPAAIVTTKPFAIPEIGRPRDNESINARSVALLMSWSISAGEIS